MGQIGDTSGDQILDLSGRVLYDASGLVLAVASQSGRVQDVSGNTILDLSGVPVFGVSGLGALGGRPDITLDGIWLDALAVTGQEARRAMSARRQRLQTVRTAGDSFSVEIAVKTQDGVPVNLDGASVTAGVEAAGQGSITGAVTILDPSSGLARCDFARSVLALGVWQFQMRVRIGERQQTVRAFPLQVNRSFL